VRANGEARTPSVPAAYLGQHTDEILLEVLGLSSAAVGKLHDSGIVAGPESDRTLPKGA
jgi:2-methylfumaryl-CoA isomerase